MFARRYWRDPAGFVRECIDWSRFPGEEPTEYQIEILDNVVQYGAEAVRGPRGLGKTTVAAWLILWFATTRDAAGADWKIITTASYWRQVEKFLWPEVHKWARALRFDTIGRPPFARRDELMNVGLRLGHGEAFAVVSDDNLAIEGVHADQLLYVYDESKGIARAAFDSSEGAFSGAGVGGREAYRLAISTPGAPAGTFYDIFQRRPGYTTWHAIHVTIARVVTAGRVSQRWVDEMGVKWGKTSALYLNHVLGEFAAPGDNGVVPLAWIEQAVERWRHYAILEDGAVLAFPEALAAEPERYGMAGLSCDPAYQGDDLTAIGRRYEADGRPVGVGELEYHAKEDTMQTTGRLKADVDAFHPGRVTVDVVGIGAGIVDRLREQDVDVFAFSSAKGTRARDKAGEVGFNNWRSAAYWHVRELLDPSSGNEIALPPDDNLIGDLAAITWKMTSGGKIQVLGKDEVKKVLGRSTDAGDAVVMLFADGILERVAEAVSRENELYK